MGNTASDPSEIPEYSWLNVAPVIPKVMTSKLGTANYMNLAALVSDNLAVSTGGTCFAGFLWFKSIERDYINEILQNAVVPVSVIFSADIAKYMASKGDTYYARLASCYSDEEMIKKYFPDLNPYMTTPVATIPFLGTLEPKCCSKYQTMIENQIVCNTLKMAKDYEMDNIIKELDEKMNYEKEITPLFIQHYSKIYIRSLMYVFENQAYPPDALNEMVKTMKTAIMCYGPLGAELVTTIETGIAAGGAGIAVPNTTKVLTDVSILGWTTKKGQLYWLVRVPGKKDIQEILCSIHATDPNGIDFPYPGTFIRGRPILGAYIIRAELSTDKPATTPPSS